MRGFGERGEAGTGAGRAAVWKGACQPRGDVDVIRSSANAAGLVVATVGLVRGVWHRDANGAEQSYPAGRRFVLCAEDKGLERPRFAPGALRRRFLGAKRIRCSQQVFLVTNRPTGQEASARRRSGGVSRFQVFTTHSRLGFPLCTKSVSALSAIVRPALRWRTR